MRSTLTRARGGRRRRHGCRAVRVQFAHRVANISQRRLEKEACARYICLAWTYRMSDCRTAI